MDTHDILSGIAILLSLAAGAMGLRKHDVKKHEAMLAARHDLGRRYAQLAWAWAKSRPGADDPRTARALAVSAFVLADTSADGKRDFTDKQVGVYLDAELSRAAEAATR